MSDPVSIHLGLGLLNDFRNTSGGGGGGGGKHRLLR